MATSRWKWAASTLLALGVPALATGQEVTWKTVARASSSPQVVASASGPVQTPSPAASLGRPVAIAAATQIAASPAPQYPASPFAPAVVGRSGPVFRGQAPDPDPPSSGPWPPPPPASVIDEIRPVSAREEVGRPALPDLALTPKKHDVWQPSDPPPPDYQPGVEMGQPVTPAPWGEKMFGWFEWGNGNGRGPCHDPCANSIISPVTAPFYFEDPRALTELRPLLMYQKVPNRGLVGGGDAFFLGTQARLAFSEHFSIVLHELGWLKFDPNNQALNSNSGFAEVKIGAKYTFLTNPERGSAAAVGVMFEIPCGSNQVFQNTGDLSIAPYLSYAQTLWRIPDGYGSINFVGNMGYSFSTDQLRSEFFYSNFHLDWNIVNKFYPLIEMNWIYYTRSGNNINLGAEGADLINFGSTTTEGKNYVSLAFGGRYKFTDHIIAGGAIQFPISNEKGLQEYRLTFDLIFRY